MSDKKIIHVYCRKFTISHVRLVDYNLVDLREKKNYLKIKVRESQKDKSFTCYLTLQMPTAAMTRARPDLGSQSASWISLLGGRDPSTWNRDPIFLPHVLAESCIWNGLASSHTNTPICDVAPVPQWVAYDMVKTNKIQWHLERGTSKMERFSFPLELIPGGCDAGLWHTCLFLKSEKCGILTGDIELRWRERTQLLCLSQTTTFFRATRLQASTCVFYLL